MTEKAQHFPKRTLTAVVVAAALALSGGCDFIEAATAPRPAAQGTRPAAPVPKESARVPAGFDETEFREDLRTAEGITDGYWRRHWDKLFTGRYQPPRVVGLYDGRDPKRTPKCGDEPLQRDNAAYCPSGDFVAWDEHLMRTGYVRGDAWVYLVIAHEWGHAVQERLRRGLVSPAAELQADCLAGAVLYGSADDGTLRFEDGDEQELVDAFRIIGDDAPWTKPGDHGSAAERLRNFSRGGTKGAKACFNR